MLREKFSGAKVRERNSLDPERLAGLVDAATLMPVDRYFKQIRRDLMMLERPVGVAGNKMRMWYGYSPYDPSIIPQLLDIHRA